MNLSPLLPTIPTDMPAPSLSTDHVALTPTAEDVALQRALDLVELNHHLFRKDFRNWIKANWVIWRCFEDKAEQVWDAGRRHYSARTLIEVVRHETFLREAHAEGVHSHKINNSFVPDIARLYGLLHPSREDFFECRTMSGECVRGSIRAI